MRFVTFFCALTLLAACTNRDFTPVVPEALDVGTPYTVFAASTRERKSDGSYGSGRSTRINRLELTVSIPPARSPGEIDYAYSRPKPETQFTIAGRDTFEGRDDFLARIKSELRKRPVEQREVSVFVHGYNVTQAETAMRAAQMANDIGLPGVLLIYSWPSRGDPLGYAYDIDSMLFARDGLEQVLNELNTVGAENLLLVAHSMGSLLTMETLRQADIRDPGWSARTLDGLMLLSPDVDVEVFRDQIEDLTPAPDPFLVMISEKDKILNLSARLRGTSGRERLGNLKHIDKVADLPIDVIDATKFSDTAQSSHFVAASPAFLAIVTDARTAAEAFGSEKLAIEQIFAVDGLQKKRRHHEYQSHGHHPDQTAERAGVNRPAPDVPEGFRDYLTRNAPWLTAGVLLTFLSSFGQTFFISIFAGEIRASFGLSHGEWGAVYSMGTTVAAVVMVWAGGLTDHFRVRTLGPVVLLGLAIACLAMALNPFAWALVGVVFLLRIFGQSMTSHVATVAMTRWFTATRGRALSIATLGYAIGEALLPLVFVTLMTIVDWHWLWVLVAVICLAGIPVLRHLLRFERTPQSSAQSYIATGMGGQHWTRMDALRHPLFWFMVPAILGLSAFVTAFFFHQVHFAQIKGWSHIELVSMFPIYTLAGIVAMIGSGWALDKWGTGRLIPFMQLPIVISFLIFAVATGPVGAIIGFLFMAMTTGANATLPSAFWAEFYGTAHIGAIKAMAAAVMVLGSAIGPGITGALIDMGVAWDRQFVGIAAYFLLSSALIWIGVTRARRDLTL